jgi:glycerate 2-kinase
LNRKNLEAVDRNSKSIHFALSAIEAAMRSVDPVLLIKNNMNLKKDNLIITDLFKKVVNIDLSTIRTIYIIGAGKASGKMALAVLRLLGKMEVEGAVNVPYGSNIRSDAISITEAGHPIPDENGIQGTKKILGILKNTHKFDLVIVLISGGGSALLPMPTQGITLSTKQSVTRSLLLAGASIEEVNTVRKHLSAVKGGRLLEYFGEKCRVVSIIISDVIGDDLSIVASGPTFPDCSTFQQAEEILKKYLVWDSNMAGIVTVKKVILKGKDGRIPETIKFEDPVLTNVSNIIIGNNELACKAAMKTLNRMKINTVYLGSSFGGLAIDHGRYLAHLAGQFSSYCLPSAFVLGGETVVKVSNGQLGGTGGRNQEAALASAMSFRYKKDMDLTICCVGTDGIDGNSTYAGALVTRRIFRLVQSSKEKYNEYLAEHNTSNAFRELKSLILTGRTGTNVNDISIIVRVK